MKMKEVKKGLVQSGCLMGREREMTRRTNCFEEDYSYPFGW